MQDWYRCVRQDLLSKRNAQPTSLPGTLKKIPPESETIGPRQLADGCNRAKQHAHRAEINARPSNTLQTMYQHWHRVSGALIWTKMFKRMSKKIGTQNISATGLNKQNKDLVWNITANPSSLRHFTSFAYSINQRPCWKRLAP